MAYITVTNSFSAGTVIKSAEINQNFTDIINGTSDGTKAFNIEALTASGTITLSGLTASSAVFTNGSNELTSVAPDNAKVVLGSGSDSEIYYDGTDLIINPDAVGSGVVKLGGTVTLDGSSGITSTLPAIQLQRTITADNNARGFISAEDFQGATSRAYIGFDCSTKSSGSNNLDYLASFEGNCSHDSSGTLTKIYGLGLSSPEGDGGAITTCYGLGINDFSGTATVTTHYGIKIEDLTHAGTSYSIYTGSATSYFGGDMTVIGDFSGAKVQVLGDFDHDGSNFGVFSATPVAQQAHIVDADGTLADITTKFNTLLTYFETGTGYGFLADS